MNGDSEVRIRMASAEVDGILEKYQLQMVVVEVVVDGNHLLRQIRLLDRQPIVGVQLGLAQGVAAGPVPPRVVPPILGHAGNG